MNRIKGALLPLGNSSKAFTMVLLLVITGFFSLPSCTNDTSPPIRIGTNVWPGYELLYLARSLEYYDPETIHLVEFSSTSEVIRQFRNASLDVAALTLDETLFLLEEGFDIVVFLVTDVSDGGDVILGKKGMTSFQDIKGHPVGVEGSALGAYLLSRALEINAMESRDIAIIQRDVSEHEKAFKNGEIDVVVTFEPVRSKLLAQGATVLFDSTQIPDEIVDVLVVRRSYLKDHQQQIKAVLDGWFKALEHLKKYPKDSAARMAIRQQITPEAFLNSLDGIHIPSYEENLEMLSGDAARLNKSLPKLATTMREHNLLKEVIDTSSLLDGTPMERLK